MEYDDFYFLVWGTVVEFEYVRVSDITAPLVCCVKRVPLKRPEDHSSKACDAKSVHGKVECDEEFNLDFTGP